ncbi:MAG: hypothetical protein JW850_06270 [Thermoflexales bacterium]|nr:hypothetical protein [Thermoflexales bacterium]
MNTKEREVFGRAGKGVRRMSSFCHPHHMDPFSTKNGKTKLAYGRAPADTLEILSFYLTEEGMAEIVQDDYLKISQRKLQAYVHWPG